MLPVVEMLLSQSHSNLHRCVCVCVPISLVTMVLSCIVSEIKRDIGRKSQFLSPLYTTNHHVGKPAANVSALFFATEPDPWPTSFHKQIL